MKNFFLTLFVLFSICSVHSVLGADGAKAEVIDAEHLTVEAISELSQIGYSEKSVLIGLDLRLKDQWHVYWRNPGDSGSAPRVEMHPLDGVRFSDILWPPPKEIPFGHLVNYGYEERVVLPIRLTFEKDFRNRGVLPLSFDVSWLVCKEDCIPGKATLTLEVPLGEESVESVHSVVLRDQVSRSGLEQEPFETVLAESEKGLILKLPNSLAEDVRERVVFFPYNGTVLQHGAPQKYVAEEGGLLLPLSIASVEPIKSLSGVLVGQFGNATEGVTRALEISARRDGVQQLNDVVHLPGDLTPSYSFFLLLMYGFIGGIILNAMPCVFPVIGIKILSFLHTAGGSRKKALIHGLVFSFGILASMWLLVGVLLFLRSTGEHIGWGFQLQSPSFVLALIFFFTFFSAHLLGLVVFGNKVQQIAGEAAAGKEGFLGSFLSGVTATFVATPCTAPFMATAIGVALSGGVFQCFAVFTALGAGIACPYMVLSLFPGLARLLPRPGAWMEILKQLLAFPLLATVLWLLWVFEKQMGEGSLIIVLTGLLLLAAGIYILYAVTTYGENTLITRIFLACGVLVLLSGPLFPVYSLFIMAESEEIVVWREYSHKAVEEARALNKPVFIDFTAAWCATCQVNKRAVLDTDAAASLFKSNEVVLFRADWTNEDPEVTKALEALGRSGVPVYVLYVPEKKEPVILPTLLSHSIIKDAMSLLS